MEAIKDTVVSVIKELSSRKQGASCNSLDPEALLKKALTKKELEHIKFYYFRRGMLCVKVGSSPWLYSLNLKKEKLLNKLNAGQASGIKDIRFVIGEV